MEQSEPPDIQFTTKCFNPELETALSEHPILSYSRSGTPNLQQIDTRRDPKPIIEIVSVVSAVDSGAANGGTESPPGALERSTSQAKARHMIVHSGTLSQTIRDVVQSYPGQILSGSTLVIQEPYACLMHHMPDLERAKESREDSLELKHLEVLMRFLRPLFERQYVPAKGRLELDQPTSRFEDLWVLMKPGLLAYTKWDGEWLGCIVEQSTKLPPKPSEDLPQRWSIEYSFLQLHWSSEQVRSARHSVVVNQYDGEKLVTSLPICPAKFHDVEDAGAMTQRLTERGQKAYRHIWEGPRYTYYHGRWMSIDKRQISERIILGVKDENWILKDTEMHHWSFNWATKYDTLGSAEPLNPAEQKLNSDRMPTMEQCTIMSPCLSGWCLISNSFGMFPKPNSLPSGTPITNKCVGMFHVDNVKPLEIPDYFPDPILSNRHLVTINELVDYQSSNDHNLSPDLPNEKEKGMTILLHGPPGVGKSYTIDYISRRLRRPIVDFGGLIVSRDLSTPYEFFQWFHRAEEWNAILLFDNCDSILHYNEVKIPSQALVVERLVRFMASSKCLLILTTNKVGTVRDQISSLVDLTVYVDRFDEDRRSRVWEALIKSFEHQDGKVVLSRSAKELLLSPETQIEWNGHEMKHCFKTAIALATAQTNRESAAERDTITVEDEHFKEAMNIAHEFRLYLKSIRGSEAEDAWRQDFRNDKFDPNGAARQSSGRRRDAGFSSNDSDRDAADSRVPRTRRGPVTITQRQRAVPARRYESSEGSLSRPTSPQRLQRPGDPSLCIPELNCVEWEAFREVANNKDLFRKTKFYAIDVLVGEPRIKLKPDRRGRRRQRKIKVQKGASMSTSIPQTMSEQNPNHGPAEPGEEPLPERIRINSPALVKAFSDITEERLTSPFLLFRPFRSLIYHEQEFRNWASQQEDILEGKVTSEATRDTTEINTDDESMQSNDGFAQPPEVTMKHVTAGLQEMRCLLSFIDNYIKKKQAYLASDRCVSVAFADLPLLFNPGDFVLTNDVEQVYRVTKVVCEHHTIKSRDDNDLNFWKDETEAEFDDNPVFVHYVHVDFDGIKIGPVFNISYFTRYQGKIDLDALIIRPLRSSNDAALRDKLISRGKMFMEVAGIKHMHYTGLTLGTRDEIDSQVVIDFDETFTRFPDWMPVVRHAADEWLLREAQTPRHYDPDSNKPEPAWEFHYRTALTLRGLRCIKECCANETVCHDEYVESERMKDYFVKRTKEAGSLAPSVSIIPRPFKSINEGVPLTDEDYLIMSYVVFGFVLRNRKWYKLDMSHVSEVAILGEGEGFDQLVLPDGHGNMVKSMIRQHLRDRKLASANSTKMDVVRGKGTLRLIYGCRGLIMLLHGVPGVGKTSTAECVAGLFGSPLFQITGGDLGTTAREVEDALEQNFNLASRWNCILLIDEADVFLGERNREDFLKNSLVAVFLRMMEYYAGILFLTTNRVGVFDEAFTSRIHISLYYPPLKREATRQIFEKNWERIRSRYEKNNKKIEIKESEITQFALDYFDNNKDGQWNGRQIRNAFQSALALAELEALGTDDDSDPLGEKDDHHDRTVVLGKKYFESVADTYKEFLSYLKQVYGADVARRARENLWRNDAYGFHKTPNALNTRLKVAESVPPAGMTPPRAPPAPGLQPQAAYGQGYREAPPSFSSGPYYQPRPQQHQYYPEQRYEQYPGQVPRQMPPQDPYAAPQDRFAAQMSDPYGRGAGGYATGPERLPQTPEQSFRSNAPKSPGFPGREAGDPR